MGEIFYSSNDTHNILVIITTQLLCQLQHCVLDVSRC